MVRLTKNISLRGYNSFGIDATADLMVEWSDAAALRTFLAAEGAPLIAQGARWNILGEGCNTLFTADYHGTLFHSTASRLEVVEENDREVVIRVESGLLWDTVVAWSCERGVWGAENLSAIPSSVGATAVQNIGAYGTEAKDLIQRVEYIELPSLEERTIEGSDCKFGYRESIFKRELAGRAIITAVHYRLSKLPCPKLDYGTLRPEVERIGEVTPSAIRRAVESIRSSKLPDPKVTGNAGSFFVNPILPRRQVEELKERYPSMPIYEVAGDPERLKIATGWMIDTLGWKGKTLGRAGVHTHQALVLINTGGATGEEVVALAERICREVEEHFGVRISPEVNIL